MRYMGYTSVHRDCERKRRKLLAKALRLEKELDQ